MREVRITAAAEMVKVNGWIRNRLCKQDQRLANGMAVMNEGEKGINMNLDCYFTSHLGKGPAYRFLKRQVRWSGIPIF